MSRQVLAKPLAHFKPICIFEVLWQFLKDLETIMRTFEGHETGEPVRVLHQGDDSVVSNHRALVSMTPEPNARLRRNGLKCSEVWLEDRRRGTRLVSRLLRLSEDEYGTIV